MGNRRVGGIISFKVEGQQFKAKGEFSFNLGKPKREMIIGSDGTHGFSEKPQVAYIEGAITDSDEISLEDIVKIRDKTITLGLANGKIIVLREGVYTADGEGKTEEGEFEVRFEGISAEEVR